MPEAAKQSAEYILPLYMNGLSGRMMHVPSSTKRQREILLIYGHHAMLERWWGLVENLREYGPVTMPDMPGFGGMQSFSKIGIKPDIDAYADYLAAFIKLRYKRKRVTVIGISFGFVVVTRMLQRYPELAKKIDMLVGEVGFMHEEDIIYSPGVRRFYHYVARFFATRPIAVVIRYVFLSRPIIKFLTNNMPNSKHRFLEVSPEEFESSLDFEVILWQENDVRTHWLTTSEFLKLNNCAKPIKLPVVHIISAGDHYLNNIRVEQHMRQVFSSYKHFLADSKAHVPSVIADKSDMAVLLPDGLRRLLAKKPRAFRL